MSSSHKFSRYRVITCYYIQHRKIEETKKLALIFIRFLDGLRIVYSLFEASLISISYLMWRYVGRAPHTPQN